MVDGRHSNRTSVRNSLTRSPVYIHMRILQNTLHGGNDRTGVLRSYFRASMATSPGIVSPSSSSVSSGWK